MAPRMISASERSSDCTTVSPIGSSHVLESGRLLIVFRLGEFGLPGQDPDQRFFFEMLSKSCCSEPCYTFGKLAAENITT